MSAPLLSCRNLSTQRGGNPAVRALDLAVRAGEVVALIGLNGAGKSSLLRTIIGLDPPAGGEIRLDGVEIGALSTAGRARLGIGYCPEGRRLFPGMTVADSLHAASRAPAGERRERLRDLTRLFPLLGDIPDRECWSLSGGQQQVVAIARALMNHPRILLLDEPSLGLAPVICRELFPAIRRIAEAGAGVLLAEQNLSTTCGALAIAGRVAVLHRGRLCLDAAAGDVSPAYLKTLLLSETGPA